MPKAKKTVEVEAPEIKPVQKKVVAKAAKPVLKEVCEGPKLVLPDQHTAVLAEGNLVGFSVDSEHDPVKGHESEFGCGHGVSAHSMSGGMTTYMIL